MGRSIKGAVSCELAGGRYKKDMEKSEEGSKVQTSL